MPNYLPTSITKGEYNMVAVYFDVDTVRITDSYGMVIHESFAAWESRCNAASLNGATCGYAR